MVDECRFLFNYSFSVLFTVVCFRYYTKILRRLNVAKKKSMYIQIMLQMMTNEKPSEIWTRSLVRAALQ